MLVTKSCYKLPLFGRVDARPCWSLHELSQVWQNWTLCFFIIFGIFLGYNFLGVRCCVPYQFNLKFAILVVFFMFDFFCSHSDERLVAGLCSGSVDNSASIRLVPSLFWECNTQLMTNDISILEKFEKFNHHLMFFLYLDISSVPIWAQAYHMQVWLILLVHAGRLRTEYTSAIRKIPFLH